MLRCRASHWLWHDLWSLPDGLTIRKLGISCYGPKQGGRWYLLQWHFPGKAVSPQTVPAPSHVSSPLPDRQTVTLQAGVVEQLQALSSPHPLQCRGAAGCSAHRYPTVVSGLGSLFLKNAKSLELFGQLFCCPAQTSGVTFWSFSARFWRPSGTTHLPVCLGSSQSQVTHSVLQPPARLHRPVYHVPAEYQFSQLLIFSHHKLFRPVHTPPLHSASPAEQAIHPWLVGLISVLPSLVKCLPESQILLIYSKVFASWFLKSALVCSCSVSSS